MWIAGLILILAGFIIRMIAIRSLAGCFSLVLNLPPCIVTTGIYRWVRHPSYVGSLMMIAGLALVDVRIAILYVAFLFFLARAVQEEQMLLMRPEYHVYRQRTGMFIPRIWS
jgi:protein-S-isoprenylcysteine O-methyltransferase